MQLESGFNRSVAAYFQLVVLIVENPLHSLLEVGNQNSSGGYGIATYEPYCWATWVVFLVAVQAFLVVVAIPSGILFLADPSGGLLGAQFILPYLTKNLPFIHDFVPVGIWLVVVYGVLPMLLDVGLLRRVRLAWLLTLALGLTVVAWIAAEVALFAAFRFTPLHPLIGGIGAAAVLLSLLPSVRRYYSRG